MTLRVPFVPSGITVDKGDVVGETKMLTSKRPERRRIETRLNNSTSTTFLASTGVVLGNTVGFAAFPWWQYPTAISAP